MSKYFVKNFKVNGHFLPYAKIQKWIHFRYWPIANKQTVSTLKMNTQNLLTLTNGLKEIFNFVSYVHISRFIKLKAITFIDSDTQVFINVHNDEDDARADNYTLASYMFIINERGIKLGCVDPNNFTLSQVNNIFQFFSDNKKTKIVLKNF